MEIIAEFNGRWIIVDTEKTNWRWAERATRDQEEKLLKAILVDGSIKPESIEEYQIRIQNKN